MTKFYIHYGQKVAMYTLWADHPRWDKAQYIQNLSNDPKEAVKKAYILAEQYGEKPDDVDISETKMSLNEITRRNQEQIAIDEEKRKKENIENWLQRSLFLLEKNKNPFQTSDLGFWAQGNIDPRDKHIFEPDHYESLENLSLKDINYWGTLGTFKSEVHKKMHEHCKPLVADLVPNKNIHFGNVGDKKVRVRVQFISVEVVDNPYSYNEHDYISKFRFNTEDGARITARVNSNNAGNFANKTYDQRRQEGDWLTIEGTIKEHNVFEPEAGVVYNTTRMIRLKLIDEE